MNKWIYVTWEWEESNKMEEKKREKKEFIILIILSSHMIRFHHNYVFVYRLLKCFVYVRIKNIFGLCILCIMTLWVKAMLRFNIFHIFVTYFHKVRINWNFFYQQFNSVMNFDSALVHFKVPDKQLSWT